GGLPGAGGQRGPAPARRRRGHGRDEPGDDMPARGDALRGHRPETEHDIEHRRSGGDARERAVTAVRSNREAQAARARVLRVRVRDLELAAEQVLFPLELRSPEVRHALPVAEYPDV